MNPRLLELVCCPACGAKLQILDLPPADHNSTKTSKTISEGTLTCANQHNYQIKNGLPHLYVDDEKWASKAIEAEGWVSIHKELKQYEPGDNAADLQIPYVEDPTWKFVAENFDVALTALKLKGNEVILDLGAGRGWAAKQFAMKGCKVVALDIADDLNVGLGRAKALMQQSGTEFDLVIGDGENLPFFPDQFDLVFCSATLHHSSNLVLLLESISNVLKPGGHFCGINEPCIAFWKNESSALKEAASKEIEHGINETLPNFRAYYNAIVASQLTLEYAGPENTYHMSEQNVITLARSVGALRSPIDISRPYTTYRNWRHYIFFRLTAMFNRQKYVTAFDTPVVKTQVINNIMQWFGGSLMIIASKPTSETEKST